MPRLTKTEQLDCLIMAIETNLADMKSYQEICERGMKGSLVKEV